jgi:hypothetical protein
LQEIGKHTGYLQDVEMVLNSTPLTDQFDARTGFVVNNAKIARVAATNGANATIVEQRDAKGMPDFIQVEPAFIQVELEASARASVAIQFSDGSGTLVAAVPDYIGKLDVDEEGILNIDYTPSRKGAHWSSNTGQNQRLEQLRANAAAASKLGAFRVETPEKANSLATYILTPKGIDPTLGLYATYAFLQAGRFEQITSIASTMMSTFGLVLFDTAMFSALDAVVGLSKYPVAPLCPMLSQGWAYLRATRAKLSPGIAEAGAHLREALWTTFEPEGMSVLLNSQIFGVRPQ